MKHVLFSDTEFKGRINLVGKDAKEIDRAITKFVAKLAKMGFIKIEAHVVQSTWVGKD
jgi:hypothetical protein